LDHQDFKDQVWQEIVEDHARDGIVISDSDRAHFEDTLFFQQRVLNLSVMHLRDMLEPVFTKLAWIAVGGTVLGIGYHLIRWALR